MTARARRALVRWRNWLDIAMNLGGLAVLIACGVAIALEWWRLT